VPIAISWTKGCLFFAQQYHTPGRHRFPRSSFAFLDARRRAVPSRHVLLTTAEAADYLRLKKHTLENMRWQGTGPPFRKHGGRVFYHRAELKQWSDQARRRSSSGERA
jgi:hypothetical protein